MASALLPGSPDLGSELSTTPHVAAQVARLLSHVPAREATSPRASPPARPLFDTRHCHACSRIRRSGGLNRIPPPARNRSRRNERLLGRFAVSRRAMERTSSSWPAASTVRQSVPPRVEEAWGTLTQIAEEVFASEIVTRVWAACVTGPHSDSTATADGAIAQSAYHAHLAIRRRLLALLTEQTHSESLPASNILISRGVVANGGPTSFSPDLRTKHSQPVTGVSIRIDSNETPTSGAGTTVIRLAGPLFSVRFARISANCLRRSLSPANGTRRSPRRFWGRSIPIDLIPSACYVPRGSFGWKHQPRRRRNWLAPISPHGTRVRSVVKDHSVVISDTQERLAHVRNFPRLSHRF